MKTICALISLLFAANALSQQLNLGAVLSGNTPDVICYIYCAPGDSSTFQKISCGDKTGIGLSLMLGAQASESSIMAQFVSSGRWNLATSVVHTNSVTTYIFTKK